MNPSGYKNNKYIHYQNGGHGKKEIPSGYIDPTPTIFVPGRLKPYGTQYDLRQPASIIPIEQVGRGSVHDIIFEHRFWLQIFHDHMRFFELSLASSETELLFTTRNLLSRLENAQANISNSIEFLNMAFLLTNDIAEHKKNVLSKHINDKIDIHLPPTFINHMLYELEQYLMILNEYKLNNKITAQHVIEYHIHWLRDGAGHATAIMSNLDPVEKLTKKELRKLKKEFESLYMEADEFKGYLRAKADFPAIKILTKNASDKMKLFVKILNEIKEMRLTNKILATLNPLILDHMIREECYYLHKLELYLVGSAIDGCDPTIKDERVK